MIGSTPLSFPSVLFNDLSFAWPDGSRVLEPSNTVFTPGRTGLIGDNGSGKTTILRLINGDLTPNGGTVTTVGEVGYLPQNITLKTGACVADLLGIRAKLDALTQIEAGNTLQDLYDTIDDDWDVRTRAEETLARIGLDSLDLGRPVGTLSGGEVMLASLSALRISKTPIVLLDEPTNNLDRTTRQKFYEAITGWDGTLIVVSHDIELLDLMDNTVELYNQHLHAYGGGYTDYSEALSGEQYAATRALRTSKQLLRQEERQRREAETRLAHRSSHAKRDYANKRQPKIVMNTRKAQAEQSAGKLRDTLDTRIHVAQESVNTHESRVRDDDRVRIDLPDPDVPPSRHMVELHHAGGVHTIAGPERVSITGPNGVGKTRLLETFFDDRLRQSRATYALPLVNHLGYLPQRLDGLDDRLSTLENVRFAAPHTPPGQIRAQLAKFLLRGDSALRPVSTLSGGERFRVALARLLLADPPYQLLVLDEPTNNVDLNTRQTLIDALVAYRGGLIIVSHDQHLLDALQVDTQLELDRSGRLNVRNTEGVDADVGN